MAVTLNIPAGAMLITKDKIKAALADKYLDLDNLEAAVEAILGEIGVTSITVGEGEAQTGDVIIDLEALGLDKVANKTPQEILAMLERAAVETLLGNTGYTAGGSVKGIIDQIKDNATKIAALQDAIGQDEDGNSLTERVTALEEGKLDATLAKVEAVLGNTGHATGGDSTYKIASDAKTAANSNASDIAEIAAVIGDYEDYSEDDILTRLGTAETGISNLKTSKLDNDAASVEKLINANYLTDGTVNSRINTLNGLANNATSDITTIKEVLGDVDEYSDDDDIITRVDDAETAITNLNTNKLNSSAFTAQAVEDLLEANNSTLGKMTNRVSALETYKSTVEPRVVALETAKTTNDTDIANIKKAVGDVANYDEENDIITRLGDAEDAIESKVSESTVTASYLEGKLGFTSWTDDADGATSLKDKVDKLAAKAADSSDVDQIKSDLEDLIEEIESDYWKKEDLDGEAIEEILGFSIENGDDKYAGVTLSMSKWGTSGDFKTYEITPTDLGVTAINATDDISIVLAQSATVVQAQAAAEASFVKGDNSNNKITIYALKTPTADIPVYIRIDVH